MNIVKWATGYKVESERTKGVFYDVVFSHMLKKMVCSCPDFRQRRLPRGEICKHISAVWDIEQYANKEQEEE